MNLLTITKTKIATGAVVGMLVFGMVAGLAPISAQAQTTPELQAQIQQLIQLITQLQTQIAGLGNTGTGASIVFTRDMTIGSTGPEVASLQNFLIAKGYSIPAITAGIATPGYFGPQTRSALAAYQAANGINPPAGYFGPITRSHVNALAVTPPTTPPPTGGPDPLQGGAGSVDSYDLISGLNNEEVGENEEDVGIAGLEIEASDGSDIEITAVRLDFDQGTANEDFEDYADEVAIWLDGQVFVRVDADEFDDDSGFSKTVTLDRGAIIRAGDTGELTVTVSGLSNIDSADVGDTWTVDFTSVRYRDAQDASISENPSTDARTFSFERFASARGVELTVRLDNDTPDAQVVDVDDSDDTDDVELLRFTLEAEGSDIELQDLPITLTSTGANVNDIASTLYLEIDGDRFSENVTTSATSATVTFDDVDFVIGEGDEVEVVVLADIHNLSGSFTEGDTLKAELTSTNRDNINAEDESGEDLQTTDMSGTALGNELAFYDVGIRVAFVSANESVNSNDGSNNDTGTFRVKYRVEEVDGIVYLSDSATATTTDDVTASTVLTDGVLYRVLQSNTATTAGLSDAVTFTTGNGANISSGGNIELSEGESTDVTLTVSRTNSTSGDSGLYRMLLEAIGWNTDDSSTYNVYDFDLEDYRTDPANLN